MSEGMKYHEINLHQDDLFIQLISDDMSFIARQMERWMRLFVDPAFQPTAFWQPPPPPQHIETPPAVQIPIERFPLNISPDPTPQFQEALAPKIAPPPGLLPPSMPPSRELELAEQIRQLQQQISELSQQALQVQKAQPVSPPPPALQPELPAFSPPPSAFSPQMPPAYQPVMPPLSQYVPSYQPQADSSSTSMAVEAPPQATATMEAASELQQVEPTAQETADLLSGFEHFETQPEIEAKPKSFEQPVENSVFSVNNGEGKAELVEVKNLVAPEIEPEPSPFQQPVENFGEPLTLQPEPEATVEQTPVTTPEAQEEDDFDALLTSLMQDLEEEEVKPAESSPVGAQEMAPAVTEETESPLPEMAPFEEEPGKPTETIADAPVSVFPSLADLGDIREESWDDEEIVPAEPFLEEPVEDASVAAMPIGPDTLPEDPAEAASTDDAELDGFAQALEEALDDDQSVEDEIAAALKGLDEDQGPMFNPPVIEYDFGIPGIEPSEDPSLRRLSLESLQENPIPLDAFESPFPNPLEEEGELEAGSQKAPAPALPPAPQPTAKRELAKTPAPAAATPPAQPAKSSDDPVYIQSLKELCEFATPTRTGTDNLVLAAYFLAQYKQTEKYTLKDLNAQLVRSAMTPVNHGILEKVIAEDKMALVPDLTGNSNAAEYALTPAGLEYAKGLLQF